MASRGAKNRQFALSAPVAETGIEAGMFFLTG
jgi:hypothetical protein